jgi:hypothetical protein
MYIRRDSYTAKDLKERLMEIVANLDLMVEDEILSGELEFSTTKEVISTISFDRESYCSSDEETEKLENNLSYAPPHVIHLYNIHPDEYARESDDFWERYNDLKRDVFHDDIAPYFPKKPEVDNEHGTEQETGER